MHKQNWDNLRFVLTVAKTGSVSEAARQIGVNHATVLRRIAEFEHSHGAAIFEKTTRGYRVLADKLDVIKAAKAAETAMTVVEQLAGGRAGELHGHTRVTSTDTICQTVLPGIVADMQRQSQGLFIEVVSSNAHIDPVKHRIDVAIRPTMELGHGLEGISVARLGFAVYAIQSAKPGWIGLAGPLARSLGAKWMAKAVSPDDLVAAGDSFYVLRELAATGCGRTILPCIIGDNDHRLRRIDAGMPNFEVPIWVASHADLSATPRVRMLRDRFATALADMADHLRYGGLE